MSRINKAPPSNGNMHGINPGNYNSYAEYKEAVDKAAYNQKVKMYGDQYDARRDTFVKAYAKPNSHVKAEQFENPPEYPEVVVPLDADTLRKMSNMVDVKLEGIPLKDEYKDIENLEDDDDIFSDYVDEDDDDFVDDDDDDDFNVFLDSLAKNPHSYVGIGTSTGRISGKNPEASAVPSPIPGPPIPEPVMPALSPTQTLAKKAEHFNKFNDINAGDYVAVVKQGKSPGWNDTMKRAIGYPAYVVGKRQGYLTLESLCPGGAGTYKYGIDCLDLLENVYGKDCLQVEYSESIYKLKFPMPLSYLLNYVLRPDGEKLEEIYSEEESFTLSEDKIKAIKKFCPRVIGALLSYEFMTITKINTGEDNVIAEQH